MHSRKVISGGMLLAAGILPLAGAHALEVTTESNNRASNAALVRKLAADRTDQLAEIAALQLQVDALLICTGKGRFYAPGEAGADGQGCTEITVTVY